MFQERKVNTIAVNLISVPRTHVPLAYFQVFDSSHDKHKAFFQEL